MAFGFWLLAGACNGSYPLADNQARAAGKLQKLRQAKKDLPIAAFENDIIESVKNNTV
jgi:hypothetical protein